MQNRSDHDAAGGDVDITTEDAVQAGKQLAGDRLRRHRKAQAAHQRRGGHQGLYQ